MRITPYLIAVLFFSPALGQDIQKKHYFKEIGLTISIPTDFNIISTGDTIDMEAAKRNEERPTKKNLIYAFKNTNFFIASIGLLENNKGSNYNDADQKTFEKSYKTLKSPNKKIDSSTSIIILNGLSFKRHQLTEIENGKIIDSMVTLTIFVKGYLFAISYLYFDNKTKQEIEDILNSIKFDK
jgi:hypothetical protein